MQKTIFAQKNLTRTLLNAIYLDVSVRVLQYIKSHIATWYRFYGVDIFFSYKSSTSYYYYYVYTRIHTHPR